MKKTKRAVRKTRTAIEDIGTELSAEQLESVAGARMRRLGGSLLGGIGVIGGMLGATSTTTYPGSVTEPGQIDTATDTGSD